MSHEKLRQRYTRKEMDIGQRQESTEGSIYNRLVEDFKNEHEMCKQKNLLVWMISEQLILVRPHTKANMQKVVIRSSIQTTFKSPPLLNITFSLKNILPVNICDFQRIFANMIWMMNKKKQSA